MAARFLSSTGANTHPRTCIQSVVRKIHTSRSPTQSFFVVLPRAHSEKLLCMKGLNITSGCGAPASAARNVRASASVGAQKVHAEHICARLVLQTGSSEPQVKLYPPSSSSAASPVRARSAKHQSKPHVASLKGNWTSLRWIRVHTVGISETWLENRYTF